MMRVVGYVRVSTEEQGASGLSLEAQAKKLKAYAVAMELELIEVISDTASAKTLTRPGLQSALEALSTGRAEGLLVAKLDRLTRSVRDLAELVERYFSESKSSRKKAIQPVFHLLSVGDSINTRTASGRMVLNILASISEWEREAIVERTRDALSVKRAKGERLGAIPFGFQLGPDGLTLVENTEEQKAISRVCNLRDTGLSQRAIAEQLAVEGYRSRRGTPLGQVQISRILLRQIG